MTDCVNWDEGFCSASRISIDDEGVCLTYSGFEESLEEFEDEVVWEEEAEEEEEEEQPALEDDYEDDVVIRGRRRWDDW
jgi:hypothetical protein